MTCPHPEKVPHASFTAAIKARDSLEATDGIDLGLRPYRCGDHWHLGHRRKPRRGLAGIAKARDARRARRRRTA